jgi:hypothetical protein
MLRATLALLFCSACGAGYLGESATVEIQSDAEALVAELTAACARSSAITTLSVSPDVTEPIVYPDAPLRICVSGLPAETNFVYGYPWRATESAYRAIVTGTANTNTEGQRCFSAPRAWGEMLTEAGEPLEQHRIELEPGSFLAWANWSDGNGGREWACTTFRAEDTVPEGVHPMDGRKYHPGHYVSLNRWDGPAIFDTVQQPGVVGVQVRYEWIDLEPAYNQYDFSAIRTDLDRIAGTGLKLVAFIEDKSFRNERYTPPYLWESHTLPIRQATPGEGFVSKRWAPWVVQRWLALMDALSAELDGHPDFEGVAIQETAIGIIDAVADAEGYTPEKYRDALIDQVSGSAARFDSSRVFWYVNFLKGNQSYLTDAIGATYPLGVAIGGPDVLPDNYALNVHVYPKLRALNAEVEADQAIVFNSCQYDSFRHEHADPSAATKYWTPAELIQWARSELKIRYLFWNRPAQPSPWDSYDIDHAYEALPLEPLP